MADNTTGLLVQTLTGQFVATKLVDTGGTNVASVSAAGALKVDASGVAVPITDNSGSLTVDAPVTTPVFVSLSDGAAALKGSKTSANSVPVVIASDQGAVSITGTVTATTPLLAAAVLADATANPTITQISGYLMGYNGATWDRVRTANTGRLQVDVVTGGGATQYVGDAAATSTPTGGIDMGLANAAAPTDVSANNDAVALWALRNGSLVVNLASGGTLITLGNKANASSIPVSLSSDGYGSGAAAAMHVVLGTGAADYTLFGQTQATAPYARISDGTTTAGVIVATTALKVDLSSVAGTATVTGGLAGSQGVGGLAATGATAAGNPVMIGAVYTTAQPSVTTGQVGDLQMTAHGALFVAVGTDGFAVTLGANQSVNLTQIAGASPSATNPLWTVLSTGAAAYTLFGQTAAASPFTRITDATTTVGVIVATTALKTDLSSIAGTAPSATSAVPSRLTDGTAYYAKTGQTAGTAAYAQLSDQTNTVSVIAATNALKVDLSSIIGTVPGATNPIPVRLTDGAAFYSGASAAPASPHKATATSSALGAGSTATMNHYVTNGKTGQLIGMDVASTVPLRVQISTAITGSPTSVVVLFAPPFTGLQWRAPYKTFITQAAADSTSGFQCVVKNLDPSVAADVYSTGYWDEI